MGIQFLNDKPLVYGNVVQISATFADFIIVVGYMKPGRAREADVVARIVISPQLAKEFGKAMAIHLDKYERVAGTIPAPPPEVAVLPHPLAQKKKKKGGLR